MGHVVGTDTGAPDTGVDSGPVALVPCTTAGQTGCVQCQGNSNNLCSPTEALIVQQDIKKGLATAAGPGSRRDTWRLALCEAQLD